MQTYSTKGSHVLADIIVPVVQHKETVVGVISEALKTGGMTILNHATFDFEGGGFTSLWLLAESHFSIHTYPEHNYYSMDCYTCGDVDSSKIIVEICEKLGGKVVNKANIIRGL